MKLSIIVPMYNVEMYIEECLNSLVHQTFEDFEVLVINDGSTDKGPQLVETFCQKYEFIHQYHKENGGLSDARNYGITQAKGEYIAFLDSDDWVEPTLYEKMVRYMDAGLDVVVTNINYFYEDEKKSWVLKGLSSWENADIHKKALLSPLFAWNKLYRRKFFDEQGYRYPLNTWYEDIPVTIPIFVEAKTIGFLDETLIHYRQRKGSIMSSRESPRVLEIFSVLEQVRNQVKKMGVEEKYYDELEYLHIEHLCLYGMFRVMHSSYFQGYYDQVQKVMHENYPNWKKNPYIRQLNYKNRIFLKGFSLKTKEIFSKFIH